MTKDPKNPDETNQTPETKVLADLKLLSGKGEKNKVKEDIRKVLANYNDIVKQMSVLAKMTKTKYDSLIAEGFTPAQALELCKKL